MGRKPNAIVQEYFHRGQKLTDASNRYAHTCKRCGVNFPKGRVDSLMSHLLRRCPSITQEDRHLIYDAVQQQNPDLHRIHRQAAGATATGEATTVPAHHPSNHPHHHTLGGAPPQHEVPPAPPQQQQQQQRPRHDHHHHQHHPDLHPLPILLPPEQSALDTLAEVSRRHLDYSAQRHAHDARPDAEREIAEQALLAQLQGNGAVPFLASPLPGSAGSQASVQAEQGDDAQPHHFLEPNVTTTIPSSPLIHAASAANRELEQATRSASRDVLDPDLDAQIGAHLSAVRDDHDPLDMSWTSAHLSDAETFAHLTAHMPPAEPPPDLSPLVRTAKHRRRGQFSDTRRKEVQEIRKRGACIRCRMLKKSCSEGTPCSTCKNVLSARLWKSSCLRTRLADAFTLWSSGLYHFKAKIEVPAAVHGLVQRVLPGRLEVQMFSPSPLCLTFRIRQYTATSSALRDHSEHDAGSIQEDLAPPQRSTNILLLDEGEGMSSKIEEYANELLPVCISAEPSLFLRKTLETARDLIEAEEGESTENTHSSAPRSCYNLQSQQLLKNVVELWVETIILSSRDRLGVRLRYNAEEQPQQRPNLVRSDPENRYPGEQVTVSARSEALIFAQLLAATESRCFVLSRSVMNEIERRLLQRRQVSRFSTFLSSVILLNCIERMTGVYRAYDQNPSTSTAAPSSGDAESPPPSFSSPDNAKSRPSDWPLQDAPHKYWTQGPYFADLLIMLLRMRALPPQTIFTAGEYLVVNQEHPLPASVHRRPKEEQSEEQRAPALWLDPLQLSVTELMGKRDGAFPGHDQDIAEWDLRFISRVLLPEGFA